MQFDYQNHFFIMLFAEIARRLMRLLWLLFTFGMISVINALFIRIAVKCSVLIIFPMIACQNRRN
jgi:hypothetical protein